MTINIIIPTFNSSSYLADFLGRLNIVIGQHRDIDFRAIFIDDGSSDTTVNDLRTLYKTYPYLSVLVLSKNFGQTSAIIAGLENSEADAYILMSVDMQEPVELITDLISYWQQGYKMCIAYRKHRTDNPVGRLFSKIFYWVIRLDQPDIPKGGFDYGIMDRQVRDHLVDKPVNFRFLQGDVVELGYEIKYIPCTRTHTLTKVKKARTWSRFKFNYFFDGIMNVIRIPFRLILLFNIFFFLTAFIILIVGLIRHLFDTPFMISSIYPHTILFILSFLLLMISFLIEFISRIYDIIIRKVEYVIKERIGTGQS